MKKIYISPETLITKVSVEHMISQSVDMNFRSTGGDGNVLVKENRSSRSNYNVWDDDWSN